MTLVCSELFDVNMHETSAYSIALTVTGKELNFRDEPQVNVPLPLPHNSGLRITAFSSSSLCYLGLTTKVHLTQFLLRPIR